MDPSRYRWWIGSSMYLANTQLEICFVVNVLSLFQVELKHDHWITTKHIMRYLWGTINYYLKYVRRSDAQLIGYTDSDLGGNEHDGRSTMGGFLSLGSYMVSWMSRKKDTISLSSVEDYYVAACKVSMEAVWSRMLLYDLFEGPMNPIALHCDNTSYICLYEDPIFHGKTKHIKKKYHYIWEPVQNGVVQLQYISTDE